MKYASGAGFALRLHHTGGMVDPMSNLRISPHTKWLVSLLRGGPKLYQNRKMSRLKLFTSKNCPKCPAAKDLVARVAKELKINEGRDYEIINIYDTENLISALKYQIASTPSFVIDEEPVFIGTMPSKKELIRHLQCVAEATPPTYVRARRALPHRSSEPKGSD